MRSMDTGRARDQLSRCSGSGARDVRPARDPLGVLQCRARQACRRSRQRAMGGKDHLLERSGRRQPGEARNAIPPPGDLPRIGVDPGGTLVVQVTTGPRTRGGRQVVVRDGGQDAARVRVGAAPLERGEPRREHALGGEPGANATLDRPEVLTDDDGAGSGRSRSASTASSSSTGTERRRRRRPRRRRGSTTGGTGPERGRSASRRRAAGLPAPSRMNGRGPLPRRRSGRTGAGPSPGHPG